MYYKELKKKGFKEDVKRKNEEIIQTKFKQDRDYIKLAIAKNSIRLKTVYPGLLIGIGNPHGSGEVNDDINVGFSFDYVSGQPYIPGSSVKGVLRSYFKYYPEAIREIMQDANVDIKELEKELFEGNDIFFDAVIYKGNRDDYLMGRDYITPHSKATKNPIPISMIKILPNVQLEFRFQLYRFSVLFYPFNPPLSPHLIM